MFLVNAGCASGTSLSVLIPVHGAWTVVYICASLVFCGAKEICRTQHEQLLTTLKIAAAQVH